MQNHTKCSPPHIHAFTVVEHTHTHGVCIEASTSADWFKHPWNKRNAKDNEVRGEIARASTLTLTRSLARIVSIGICSSDMRKALHIQTALDVIKSSSLNPQVHSAPCCPSHPRCKVGASYLYTAVASWLRRRCFCVCLSAKQTIISSHMWSVACAQQKQCQEINFIQIYVTCEKRVVFHQCKVEASTFARNNVRRCSRCTLWINIYLYLCTESEESDVWVFAKHTRYVVEHIMRCSARDKSKSDE